MTNRPNLLLIIADQLRADFVGCYGASYVKTPHIDPLFSDTIDWHLIGTGRKAPSRPICQICCGSDQSRGIHARPYGFAYPTRSKAGQN